MDLCPSVEDVKVFNVNESLTGFQENVLNFVRNDKKVLVIVVSDFSQIFDNVKEAMPTGSDIFTFCLSCSLGPKMQDILPQINH